MRYIVGSYAAAPTPFDPEQEGSFLAGLAALPLVGGLELAFTGALHHDVDWLLARVDQTWDFVVTAIPGTMARLSVDPSFGLASPEDSGRQAALEFTARLHEAAVRLNDALGRRAVRAVELHSAPSRTADAGAFVESLQAIAAWEWHGIRVTVEHCDALSDHPPQKGFLSMRAEIAAVHAAASSAATDLGVTVNWARSVIEKRDPVAAAAHVQQAREAGVLAGLMFSGCASVPTAFGTAWVDAHLPPSSGGEHAVADLAALEPSSLLTPELARDCWGAAGDELVFAGLKIGVRPVDLDVAGRLAYVRDGLELLERARQSHSVAPDSQGAVGHMAPSPALPPPA